MSRKKGERGCREDAGIYFVNEKLIGCACVCVYVFWFGLQKSTHSPLTSMFWRDAESPFQFLGAAMELVDALESPNPELFESFIPVHQDGSCNGLQHYAALGRDAFGGSQVNLTPGKCAFRATAVMTFFKCKLLENFCQALQEPNHQMSILAWQRL